MIKNKNHEILSFVYVNIWRTVLCVFSLTVKQQRTLTNPLTSSPVCRLYLTKVLSKFFEVSFCFSVDLYWFQLSNMQLITKMFCFVSPFNSHIFCSKFLESLESPESPVFCTPGFKIKKRRVPSSPEIDGQNNLASPPRQNCPSTPEFPAFETPFVSKLLKKVIHSSTQTFLSDRCDKRLDFYYFYE